MNAPIMYPLSLDDMQLMADVTAQLDAMKNLIPSECPDVRESAVLVNRCHSTLIRALGTDAHLIYSDESNEASPT